MKNQTILLFLVSLTCIFNACKKEEKPPEDETYSNLVWATEPLPGFHQWSVFPIVSDDYLIVPERVSDGTLGGNVVFNKFDKATGAFADVSAEFNRDLLATGYGNFIPYKNKLIFLDNTPPRLQVMNLDQLNIEHQITASGFSGIWKQGSIIYYLISTGIGFYDLAGSAGAELPLPGCSVQISDVTNISEATGGDQIIAYKCFDEAMAKLFNLTKNEPAGELEVTGNLVCLQGELLFTADANLYCYDWTTGELVWQKNGVATRLKTSEKWIVQDAANALLALDAATGQILWNVAEEAAIEGMLAGNGAVYFLIYDQKGEQFFKGRSLSDGGEVLKFKALNEHFQDHFAFDSTLNRVYLQSSYRVLCFQL